MAAITEKDSENSNDPAVERLTEKANQFSDEADALRATTDRAAKGLGALATAGFTAVGIAKVGDLYPLPSGYWAPLIFLWLGFFLMVVAIVAFVIRFWRANRPLAMSSRLAEMCGGDGRYTPPDRQEEEPDLKPPGVLVKDIGKDECEDIERIYKDAMRHAPFSEGDESLAHYEWRADKLERDALHTPDSPISKRRLAQVERMRAEIEKAEQRAKLVVVRRRMNRVFTQKIAVVFAIVFVIGLIMFAAAADYFDSKHPSDTGTGSEATRYANIVD